MKTCFVTGATGAIGSALIPVLLEDPEIHIVLLLRASSAAELAMRCSGLFAFWQIDADDDRRQRIRALQGDVTLPNLGLGDADYATLRATCTHIIHSAGNVRMNLPIEQARRSSVDSARNIARLGRDCPHLQKIEFVSTVGVGGRMRGVVPETWMPAERGSPEFHNTYEQAKAEAEAFIRTEIDQGLPVTVHRPSMVVGDSRTGRIIHFQIFYHLCEFLSGRRTLGLSPRFGAARLDTIPADYVAKAIFWSSQTHTTAGNILHLCSGNSAIPLEHLRTEVRAAFIAGGMSLPPRLIMPTRLFKSLLSGIACFLPDHTRRAIRTLPVFLDYLETFQTFANDQTNRLLASNEFHFPQPEAYLPNVISCYLDSYSSSARREKRV